MPLIALPSDPTRRLYVALRVPGASWWSFPDAAWQPGPLAAARHLLPLEPDPGRPDVVWADVPDPGKACAVLLMAIGPGGAPYAIAADTIEPGKATGGGGK